MLKRENSKLKTMEKNKTMMTVLSLRQKFRKTISFKSH